MKNNLVLILFLLFFSFSCKRNTKNSNNKLSYITLQDLTGTAWEMDYSMEILEDTTIRHVPKNWLRIKTFTKNRFTFTGYDFDSTKIAGIGGGTYTLVDSTYIENIEFHHNPNYNGNQFKGGLHFDSIYLYQTGKVGDLILEERWHRID